MKALERLRQMLAEAALGAEYSAREMKRLLSGELIPPRRRIEELRPLVFTDWDSVMGWAQEIYEELVFELGDQELIDEYLDEFGAGEDGMCACHRRSIGQ